MLKSSYNAPLGDLIIFDEFLLDNGGTYRYLKHEVTMMLDVIETVGRLRDIQVIFLGNSLSITNPYFAYFELDLPDTETGRNAYESISRGDVDGVSFGFNVRADSWEYIKEEDIYVRRKNKDRAAPRAHYAQ